MTLAVSKLPFLCLKTTHEQFPPMAFVFWRIFFVTWKNSSLKFWQILCKSRMKCLRYFKARLSNYFIFFFLNRDEGYLWQISGRQMTENLVAIVNSTPGFKLWVDFPLFLQMVVGRLGRVGAAVHQGNVLEIRRSERGRALTQNLMPTEHIVLDLMPNVLTAQVNIPTQLTFIYLKSFNKYVPF